MTNNSSSNKILSSKKIAILAANGFDEQDVTQMQRTLIEAGANVRMISPDHGLINGWTGKDWGHHFAVDYVLSKVLGVDYDVLVIPGGQRSHDKLKLTGHTRRFISSIIEMNRPVAVMGDAIRLLVDNGLVQKGVEYAGPMEMEAGIHNAGGLYAGEDILVEGNVITGATDNLPRRQKFIDTAIQVFSGQVVSGSSVNNDAANDVADDKITAEVA